MKQMIGMLKRLRIVILVAACLAMPLLPSGCVPIPFSQGIDLGVEISTNVERVPRKGDLTYTIFITDTFPMRRPLHFSVNQTFSLPVEIREVLASDPEMTCGHQNNIVSCSKFGNSTPNDSFITVRVRPLEEGQLISAVEISGLIDDGLPVFDINHSNDRAKTRTTVGPVAGPDFSVMVNASPDPVAAGSELTYQITITNIGTETATSVTMIDTLPAGVIDITPAEAGCESQSDNTRRCEFSALAIGESRMTTIVVIPTRAGIITNSVSVQDGAPILTTTTVGRDLAISMLASPNPVLAGEVLTYKITITNNGPETRVDDLSVIVAPPAIGMPPNVEFVFVTAPEGSTFTCSLERPFAVCSGTVAFNPLDPACPNCATVTLGVRPMEPRVLITTAKVNTSVLDPNLTNNEVEVTTTVQPRVADLAVTMTDNPDPVVRGRHVTYTVNVTNNGPATATNVHLIDTLPANATLISITPSQGSCPLSGNPRTCNLGSIASGASATLAVVVSPQVAGTLTNQVRVTASENDPVFANNEAGEDTTVNQSLAPDLSVTVSDSPDPVVVNQSLTYTITVRNNGQGAAEDLSVTATLPSSVTPDHRAPCSTNANNAVVCQFNQLGLLSGDQVSYQLVVTPTATGPISNTVAVTLSQTDANPADNTFTETTTVSPPAPTANVAIFISDSPDPVAVDQSLTYTITVTNHGLATATGIIATAYLPLTLRVGAPFCVPHSGELICQLSAPFSLGNGQSTEFTLRGFPTVPGPITASADAFANETDPDTTNNSARQMTNVQPPPATADLEIVSVTDSPDPWVVNDQFTYTITVRNNGLSDATGVVLTNTLPATVSSDGGPDCPAGNGPVIQCFLANMSSGSTGTVFFRARSSVPGTVTNNVSVSAQETDPDSSNNTRAETTTIYPADSADVSVTMTATPNPVARIGVLTFTIVVQNRGPRTARGVSLSGFSKATMEIGAILPTQGTCTQTPTNISCDVGALGNGGSATVTIVAIPHFAGILDRTITATTSSNDPNPANNTASVSVTVN